MIETGFAIRPAAAVASAAGIVALAILTASALAPPAHAQDAGASISQLERTVDDHAIRVDSSPSGQTIATKSLMREKLTHAENILDALMTSNFVLLQRESASLSAATRLPAWAVLKTPEYDRYSAEFARVADDLVEAAQRRDLDAAALRYVSLTLSCYQCHRYIKGARIVR